MRLTLWFLIIGLFPLTLSILIPSIQKFDVVKYNSTQKLTAIRDLRVEQLHRWLSEKQLNLKTLSEDNDLIELSDFYDNNLQAPKAREIYNNIKNELKSYIGHYKEYIEIFIINPKTGKIIISTDPASLGEDKSKDPYFTETLKIRGNYIKDIYFDKKLQKHTMAFASPIIDKRSLNAEKPIVGILVATVDLKNSLYVLLQDRTGLGETGESLIINKKSVALNELRSYVNAPLNLKINSRAAALALKGETGIIESTDYNNSDVLAAYTFIQSIGWGFITKQNVDEIYAPIRAMLVNYAVLFLISLILLVLVASVVGRSISRPIVNMAMVSERIEKGDLSARNEKITTDELGFLARSFNKMAEVISSKFDIQENVSAISSTMMELVDMDEFRNKLLLKLMSITEASMGVFYVLDKDKNQFVHFTSIGTNPGLLQPFDAENPEGEFANVLKFKKIAHIKNIPYDSVFKFKTSAAEINPREIITLPILVDDVVVAVISLVNIKEFNVNSIEILNQSLININTAYSHILATEKTRSLAEHLAKVNEQLEAQTKEILNKSEELQRYTLELNRQNQELDTQRLHVEEANRLKSEFVSNMSHELRTPLNSIMALSRVLIMRSKDRITNEEQEYLKIIERNGKQLLSLINDILDLSKIEAGKLDLNISKVSIKSLLGTIKENLHQLAVDKGLKISLQVPDGMPLIETDHLKLNQVIQNIVGNAIKFTDKGEVKITASQTDDGSIAIVVKDTGIGIPEKDIPYIFEEFRQVDGTISRKFEGTGLGLAIAKKTIELLGGNIKASSQLGVGSTFTITIPLVSKGDIKPKQVTYYKPGSKENGRKSILVVDDDPDVSSKLSKDITEAGYKTIIASSGAEALELAEKYHPSLITLDVIMPEMDGWEVLGQLKDNPKTKDIPVIVVSVSDDLKTGLALGAVGHIFKPVDKDKLITKINNVVRASSSLLLVDDNDLDLQLMAYKLKSNKWEVNTASGGKECLDLLDKNVPDVLILDLLMPEVDGFQVLNHIRSQEKTKDLPVIIITSKNLSEQERHELERKASKVLIKSQTSLYDMHEEINRIISGLPGSPKIEDDTVEKEIPGKEEKEEITLVVVKNPEADIDELLTTLKKEGYRLEVVDEVQQSIKDLSPSGIILSVEIPEMGNFIALERLQGIEELKNTPVLIITKKEFKSQEASGFNMNYLQYFRYDKNYPQGVIDKIKLMLNPPSRPIHSDLATAENGDSSLDKGDSQSNVKRTLKEGARILVIEDNQDNRVSISAILNGQYEIIEAVDGLEGLRKAQTILPDIILLDISLPLMDGLEVTRILKANDETKSIPVIAVTAHAMKDDEERCMEAGCDAYITKPIDPEELLAKITMVFEDMA